MTTYVLLSTLTDEGRKTVKERPDRIKEVNQELCDKACHCGNRLSLDKISSPVCRGSPVRRPASAPVSGGV
jgi:hypothetical protein